MKQSTMPAVSSKSNAGFTIIELLIATAVFSIILLVCATAMIQIGRAYYKGVTGIKTQEAARVIIDDVSQAIQFTGGSVKIAALPPPGTPFVFCIGSYRYSAVLGLQRSSAPSGGQIRHVLIKDDYPGCDAGSPVQTLSSAAGFTSTSQDLVPDGMRLSKLSIVQNGNLYNLDIKVVSGYDDMLDNPGDPITQTCKSLNFGAQFCAVSELNTVVQKRL